LADIISWIDSLAQTQHIYLYIWIAINPGINTLVTTNVGKYLNHSIVVVHLNDEEDE
jgi:hypothetical protein